MSNSLDPDQARHFVRLDLSPNCLQRLSADDTCKERVEIGVVFRKVNSFINLQFCCLLPCYFDNWHSHLKE